jgi:hypothetical protein
MAWMDMQTKLLAKKDDPLHCPAMHITDISNTKHLDEYTVTELKSKLIVSASGCRQCPNCPNIGWLDSENMRCLDPLECTECNYKWIEPTLLPVPSFVLKLILFWIFDNRGGMMNLIEILK